MYADLLAKAFTFLKQHDPGQSFRGVVLFAHRNLEPERLAPYQSLLDAGQIQPFYFNEMKVMADAPLGLSILYLIRETENQAPALARELIGRARTEISDEGLRANLIELIETILIYKLASLSREEIQTMLQVHDLRETRFYQEAKEHGLKEGKEHGLKEGREQVVAIAKLVAKKKTVGEIATILAVDVDLVRQLVAELEQD